jgi:N-acetylglucosamine-6-phosphate deacetylase
VAYQFRQPGRKSVRIGQRLLGERLFLISDATGTTQQGPYGFHSQADYFVDNAGTLAGAGLTLLQAMRNCVQHVGLSLRRVCEWRHAIRPG